MSEIHWINEPEYFEDDTREVWPISANRTPVIVTMLDLDGEEHPGILRGGAQWIVMNSWGWCEKGKQL